MELEAIIEKFKPHVKKYWLALAFGSFGLILFGYGLIGLFSQSKSNKDIIFEKGRVSVDNVLNTSENLSKKEIFVDIEGQVAAPGVYTVSQNARVKDVLIAAGGLSRNADRKWVSRNLNLSLKVLDGAKIYIPSLGEEGDAKGTSIIGSDNSQSQVNINTASLSELDSLPGIGLVTAQKIINSRPYSSSDELLVKKIINSKVFKTIKDRITIY